MRVDQGEYFSAEVYPKISLPRRTFAGGYAARKLFPFRVVLAPKESIAMRLAPLLAAALVVVSAGACHRRKTPRPVRVHAHAHGG